MDKKPVKALPQVPPPSSTAAPSAGRTSMSSRQPNDDPQALQQ
ncbi:17341_t:CDS:1, partial [Acaulospora colombiana]